MLLQNIGLPNKKIQKKITKTQGAGHNHVVHCNTAKIDTNLRKRGALRVHEGGDGEQH